jgi:hypothetical protein
MGRISFRDALPEDLINPVKDLRGKIMNLKKREKLHSLELK